MQAEVAHLPFAMPKSLKVLLYLLASLLLIFIVVLVGAGPLTKHLLEKYDIQLTGREITMEYAYANPLTGYVYLNDLVIMEANSDSVFLSAEGLGVNVSMLNLLFSVYELSEVTLTKPLGKVVQIDNTFNFTDIIEKFTSEDSLPSSGDPVKFSMHGLKVVDGEFHYEELENEINYYIKNVNIDSPGFSYDVDTMPFTFAFAPGLGTGNIRGEWTINLRNLDYGLAIEVDSLDLEIINQYLRELTNYGTFAAMLNADMRSSGNFGNIQALTTTGQLAISDFHFGKNPEEDYVSFESLTIAIIEMNPENLIYRYDSVSLVKPFFRYELYDELDNLQTMFGEGGANVAQAEDGNFNLVIEIAKMVEQLSRNFFRSNYQVGRVAIYDGSFEFVDYSLSEKFLIGLEPFTAFADSVDKDRNAIEVFARSGIHPYGELEARLLVNPQDTSFFVLDYGLRKLPLSMFNPYVVTYTSFPLDRGSMEITGKWNVNNNNISSNNHLIMLDPRVAGKLKSKSTKWIPMPLALAFLRENGNVIDYEIPIKGSMGDPKFKVKDILLDLLRNIFVKPVTTPYRMEVRNTEQKLEQSLNMAWAAHQCGLTKEQEKFIEKMVDFLIENPVASIKIRPMNFMTKEKEALLLYAAKKRFFMNKSGLNENTFSEKDSIDVARMSVKDADFIRYLDKKTSDPTLFTVQHKAAQLIAPEAINRLYNLLNNKRKKAFLALFEQAGCADRVKFSKSQNTIPFNGFSFYDISYEGDFPDYLREAFQKMSALDKENPREKYRKKRDRNTP